MMLILMDSRRVDLTFAVPGATSKKKNRAIWSSGLLAYHKISYCTGSGILLSKKTPGTCSNGAFSSQKSCFVSQVNSPLRFQHMIRLILPTKKAGYSLGIGAKYHSVSCGSQWCQGCRGLEGPLL